MKSPSYVVKFECSTKKNNDVEDLSLSVNVKAHSKQEAEARAYAQLIAYNFMNRWQLVSVEEDK